MNKWVAVFRPLIMRRGGYRFSAYLLEPTDPRSERILPMSDPGSRRILSPSELEEISEEAKSRRGQIQRLQDESLARQRINQQ